MVERNLTTPHKFICFTDNTVISQRKEFKLLANSIKMFTPPEYPYQVIGGNRMIKQTDFDDKNFILEAFKKKDINNLNNKQLISNYNYDKLIKFRQFY